jgi:transcriptional regulator with XRE-family HTH domain
MTTPLISNIEPISSPAQYPVIQPNGLNLLSFHFQNKPPANEPVPTSSSFEPDDSSGYLTSDTHFLYGNHFLPEGLLAIWPVLVARYSIFNRRLDTFSDSLLLKYKFRSSMMLFPHTKRQWKMELGKALTAIRIERKLTLSAVAQRSGISISYLSEIENDKKTPDIKVLERICDSLSVPLPILIFKAVNEKDISDPDKSRLVREIKPLFDLIAKQLYDNADLAIRQTVKGSKEKDLNTDDLMDEDSKAGNSSKQLKLAPAEV